MKSKFNSKYIPAFVFAILIFRLVMTVVIPLLDKTEARYAEIARIMWETNQWVMPHVDYNMPFWAKPPMSTWLSSGSYVIFGVNEFAARFPSYLIGIILIFIAGKFTRKTTDSFFFPAFILLTIPEFLIHCGVVSTDSALALCTTTVMLCFWKRVNGGQRIFAYLVFFGMGLGFLAKGPLILVLTLPSLFLWTLIQRNFWETARKFDWIAGLLLMLLISAPWYYLAEKETPGFLDYFFVGEHFKRFTEPGWKGDLYGRPKSQPFGMIWVFLLLFGFPWIQIVGYQIWKLRKSILNDRYTGFLLLWLLWTPLFFTASRNILHTYLLPVTVPLMLLALHFFKDSVKKNLWIRTALIFPVTAFAASFLLILPKSDFYLNSDKKLVADCPVEAQVLYWKEKSYSAPFYRNGKVSVIKDTLQLDSLIQKPGKAYLLSSLRDEKKIPLRLRAHLKLINTNYKTAIFVVK